MTNNKIGYKPVVYLPGPAPLNRRIYAAAKNAVSAVFSVLGELLHPWLVVFPVALVLSVVIMIITATGGSSAGMVDQALTGVVLTLQFTAWGGLAVAVLRILGAIRL